MALPILLSFQIGHDKKKEVPAEEIEALLDQIKTDVPEICGLEMRFGGSSEGPSGRIIGNSLRDVIKVCQLTETYECKISVLHLSKLGLSICEGDYNTDELHSVKSLVGRRKLNKRMLGEYFMNFWDFAVGHYGEHDEAFSRIFSAGHYSRQKRQIIKDGYVSGSKYRHVRQAFELGFGDPLFETKLLLENGYLPFNCLPNVASIAREIMKRTTLDIGHVIRGLFSYYALHNAHKEIKGRSEKNPLVIGSIEKADRLDSYYDRHREEFRTAQIEGWGALATHVHFHGCLPAIEPRVVCGANREPVYLFRDHYPLNEKTLPPDSLQFGIVKRLLNGGRASIRSATLELEKSHLLDANGKLNSGNIVQSIKSFESLLHN